MNARGVGRPLAIAATLAVAATLGAALFVMEPPSVRRAAKLDDRRVQHLYRITQAVDDHVRREKALPPDLATLAAQPGQRLSIHDPVDGTPYGYEITGERAYRLCAVFATDTGATLEAQRLAGFDWRHGAGRQCFERKAKNE